MSTPAHILGIRHHGPGSARSVLTALEQIQPEIVLVEGPPDADALLPLAAHAEMQPPVALLIYRPDEPARAVFYPFAEFSPEWQAIRWALAHEIPVRFMDLPQKHQLATVEQESAPAEETVTPPEGVTMVTPPNEAKELQEELEFSLREDPFNLLADATGHADGEQWWEEHFEKLHGGPEIFTAVMELMAAIREGEQLPQREARREAWMRQTMREARKEGYDRIAVICGARHAPALATLPPAKADAEILKGLPKATVAATWLPWTHRRLTFASGYGAGVHAPGFYAQLWQHPHPREIPARWMTRVARLLRDEGLEGSPASVIEAARLAETTACLRGRRLAGLAELNEAAQSVFCFGDGTPMRLIHERLTVGEALGTVPEEAPQVPLQRDFQKETKRLRLPPEALDRTLELDLRKPNDLDRSRLLHRLRLLGITWGKPVTARGKGTFKEGWALRWDPELEVRLIERAPWGNVIPEAATRYIVDRATKARELAELTGLAETLLLAELPEAVERTMQCLENLAALTSDVTGLMRALPPLAAVLRYGNVRQTDASLVEHIVTGLTTRICAGLPAACSALNDEAAMEMLPLVDQTHTALSTLGEARFLAPWNETLETLSADDRLHGLVSGRATRLLLDDAALPADTAGQRLSLHLSRASAPSHAAAWLQGFLSGSGLVLLHQAALWKMIDGWLSSLSEDHFTEVLPLLRRTFATFPGPERRQMGELATRGQTGAAPVAASEADDDIDEARAARILPTLALLLGSSPSP